MWNPSLSKYCRISNSTLKEFCIKLYALVYEDAIFPFDYLFRDQLISPDVNIMIQTSNQFTKTIIPENRSASEKQKDIRPIHIQNVKLPNITLKVDKRNQTGCNSRIKNSKFLNENKLKALRQSQQNNPISSALSHIKIRSVENSNTRESTGPSGP